MISLILASTPTGGIGFEGGLPWPHITDDMRWFKKQTINKPIVMGSTTWSGFGIKKPLPDRTNIVISSRDIQDADKVVSGNMVDILRNLETEYPDQEIIVIGGANVYHQAAPYADKIYLTVVHEEYPVDTRVNLLTMLDGMDCTYTLYHSATEKLPAIEFRIYQRNTDGRELS